MMINDFSVEKMSKPRWGAMSSKKTLSPVRVNSVGTVVKIGSKNISQNNSNGFAVSRKTISERFNTANSISPKSTVKNVDQGIGTQEDIGNYFPTNQSAVVNKSSTGKVFNTSTLTHELAQTQNLHKEASIGKRQQVKLKEKNGSAASIITDYMPPNHGQDSQSHSSVLLSSNYNSHKEIPKRATVQNVRSNSQFANKQGIKLIGKQIMF